MGSIREHDIDQYIEDYCIKHYVETGTGEGECLSYVITRDLDSFHSIEIYTEIYNKTIQKFNQNNVKIYNGNSYEMLPTILNEIRDGNILFWLDAHFPGVDFHYEKFDSEKDPNKQLPLEQELRVIKNSYKINNSVIIIDDLRIYEDGPYGSGNWSDRRKYGSNGIDFIYEMFDITHNITKDYRSQGYIILTPKQYRNDNI